MTGTARSNRAAGGGGGATGLSVGGLESPERDGFSVRDMLGSLLGTDDSGSREGLADGDGEGNAVTGDVEGTALGRSVDGAIEGEALGVAVVGG